MSAASTTTSGTAAAVRSADVGHPGPTGSWGRTDPRTSLLLILVISIHLPLQAKEVVAILFGLTGWSALTVRLIRALRRRDQSGLLPHVDL